MVGFWWEFSPRLAAGLVCPPSSGGWKSETGMVEWSGSGESPLSSLHTVFSLCPYINKERSLSLLFLRDHGYYWIRASPLWYNLTLITSWRSYFEIQSNWEWRLQHMNFGRMKFSPEWSSLSSPVWDLSMSSFPHLEQ